MDLTRPASTALSSSRQTARYAAGLWDDNGRSAYDVHNTYIPQQTSERLTTQLTYTLAVRRKEVVTTCMSGPARTASAAARGEV